MHVPFDVNLLNFRDVSLYKCANARSGFIFARENGIDVKIPMSSSVCRKHKDMYFKNPVPIRVLFYGDDAITFTFINDSGVQDLIVSNIEQFKNEIESSKKTHYYNGEFVYSLDYDEGTFKLTETDYIKHVKLPAYNLRIASNTTIEKCKYDAVMVGDFVSFPLWSAMYTTFARNFKISGMATYLNEFDDSRGMLDDIDTNHVLNLHGLLRVCDVSASMFGAESIEVFNLVEHIIEHNTVNLPSLPKHIRATAPTGVYLSDIIAYHIGKLKKVNTYKEVKRLTESLSFCVSFCIIRKDLFDVSKVLKGDSYPTLQK